MNNNFINLIPRVFIIILLGTLLPAQQLDSQDIAYNELRDIVQTAARSQQHVFVEIFTGTL